MVRFQTLTQLLNCGFVFLAFFIELISGIDNFEIVLNISQKFDNIFKLVIRWELMIFERVQSLFFILRQWLASRLLREGNFSRFHS